MKSLPNIEKSAFRKGEYVGYAEGKVYRISRYYEAWRAINRDDPLESHVAPTLGGLSYMLRKHA